MGRSMRSLVVWWCTLAAVLNSHCATAGGDLDYKAPETTIIFSCMAEIGKLQFDFDSENYWEGNCVYPPKAQTFTACFEETGVNFNKSLDLFASMCNLWGGLPVTSQELYVEHLNGTRYLSNYEAAPGAPPAQDSGVLLTWPVVPDVKTVLRYNRAYQSYFNTINRASDIGNVVNHYWLVVLSVIALFNLAKSLKLNQKIMRGGFVNRVRAWTTIPTLAPSFKHLDAHKVYKIESLLPTRQEFYILAFYFAICIYGVSTTYVVYPDNPLFGAPKFQWSRFVADRTGILAFTQLPLLFLFGGRNNILIQLTGLQYNSFIIFHKWISRVMFSCALVHGLAYSYYAYAHGSGHLSRAFTHAYWDFGVLALVTCLGIMVQAVYRFRKICYEIFLVLHIALALVFIAACIAHCWTIGWLQWCYYAAGLWAVDRVLRLYRIFKFGFPMATVEVMSEADPTVKISIPKPPSFKFFAGSYVFIHFLDLNYKFWESHPFSVFENGTDDGMVYIILKPKLGMTSKLFERVRLLEGKKCLLRVAVEGPYGHHVPKKPYDEVVLLAGGNGIPGPFFHAVEAMKSRSHGQGDVEDLKSNVTLCWVIRDLESLNWFNKELQLLCQFNIGVEIYVTREKLPQMGSYGSVDVAVASGAETSSNWQLLQQICAGASNVGLYNNRPDFEKLLRNKIQQGGIQSLNVISCGNPIMCDSIRNGVADLLAEFTDVRIDLFEELQTW